MITCHILCLGSQCVTGTLSLDGQTEWVASGFRLLLRPSIVKATDNWVDFLARSRTVIFLMQLGHKMLELGLWLLCSGACHSIQWARAVPCSDLVTCPRTAPWNVPDFTQAGKVQLGEGTFQLDLRSLSSDRWPLFLFLPLFFYVLVGSHWQKHHPVKPFRIHMGDSKS